MNPVMPKPLQPDCLAALLAVTTQERIYAPPPLRTSLRIARFWKSLSLIRTPAANDAQG
jgi:hypothetical protein